MGLDMATLQVSMKTRCDPLISYTLVFMENAILAPKNQSLYKINHVSRF